MARTPNDLRITDELPDDRHLAPAPAPGGVLLGRRGFLAGLAGTALAGLPLADTIIPAAMAQTTRDGRAFRSIEIHNVHTRERGRAPYWVDGLYDRRALAMFDYLMRDWRQNEVRRVDPRVYDILWWLREMEGVSDPIQLHSGFRTLKTNQLLRERGHAAAVNSFHLRARAVDFSFASRGLRRIRENAMSLGCGGVGAYDSFVHCDTGPRRTWSG